MTWCTRGRTSGRRKIRSNLETIFWQGALELLRSPTTHVISKQTDSSYFLHPFAELEWMASRTQCETPRRKNSRLRSARDARSKWTRRATFWSNASARPISTSRTPSRKTPSAMTSSSFPTDCWNSRSLLSSLTWKSFSKMSIGRFVYIVRTKPDSFCLVDLEGEKIILFLCQKRNYFGSVFPLQNHSLESAEKRKCNFSIPIGKKKVSFAWEKRKKKWASAFPSRNKGPSNPFRSSTYFPRKKELIGKKPFLRTVCPSTWAC